MIETEDYWNRGFLFCSGVATGSLCRRPSEVSDHNIDDHRPQRQRCQHLQKKPFRHFFLPTLLVSQLVDRPIAAMESSLSMLTIPLLSAAGRLNAIGSGLARMQQRALRIERP